MRFSQIFLPTLKESPSDAEVISHKLMTRAGMIRKVAAGIYNYLPLGLKVIRKVENIVREEMNRAGAQEVFMPMVIPSELWQESGRWNAYGKELLRIKDRHERDFCLGPTHEEVITDMVRREVRSYRELPRNLYQIQTKFRDEIRPRFGLMRGREFIMKDAYSFHATEEDAEREYQNMYDTYCRIFERCGLKFRAVEAETGAIGGKFSHEFMVLADTGEDAIASCNKCNYAANVEKAEIKIQGSGVRGLPPQALNGGQKPAPAGFKQGSEEKPLEKVSTPGMKSVEEVSGFLRTTPQKLIKTLIYHSDKGVVAALVRGDYEINESKLKKLLDAEWLNLADEETVRRTTNAPSGFAGPVGLNITMFADYSIQAVINGVTGANEADAHLINVNLNRDFKIDGFGDLRMVVSGDSCPRCADGNLEIFRGIEVGHVFKLGTKYSEAMNATFLNEKGQERPMIMGCYGIGIGRIAAASIEQNHDENGIIWPIPLAPFQAHLIPINVNDKATMDAAETVSKNLTDAGLDVLMDDRDERAGIKFNDADLIGIPVRLTIGSKTLKEGSVELKMRKSPEINLIKLDKVVEKISAIMRPAR
ncbi:MAG: proline--tRNA ligase [Deltaproteobacteria bacterium GWC2_42_51]|nr:MAG: proline--tRNA ligase [Deltaproteobacteria bacterium GWB2_42_7]OGP36573.1 MAG: proline--tRNA ligase [Deltaproteobacteria bacterium GWC2_42_51]OGP46376.1 MAG: proline--tRNA ligase [Deltaproteobacteria bacterium GWF2_42_12]OGQ24303.1 MAG: proline--tRNA ligase [Deltaproteobacteria bacterium RIFCSPHIGHO2_02_FULL_42_44]OGQ36044.1 MAG: proline--tRNA ligase [Deltaproteobacteria bacterium RIFCSPLOWO2_02_FULL_42_39]OGQ65910.1 MAG: proline--tRNA ligase [Deltaproteobacteria bacterium RIFCSPLOWO2_1